MSRSALRERARKLWIARHDGAKPICWCGEAADVHHDDGDPANNDPSNHVPLCRSHHVALENSLFPKRKKVRMYEASAFVVGRGGSTRHVHQSPEQMAA